MLIYGDASHIERFISFLGIVITHLTYLRRPKTTQHRFTHSHTRSTTLSVWRLLKKMNLKNCHNLPWMYAYFRHLSYYVVIQSLSEHPTLESSIAPSRQYHERTYAIFSRVTSSIFIPLQDKGWILLGLTASRLQLQACVQPRVQNLQEVGRIIHVLRGWYLERWLDDVSIKNVNCKKFRHVSRLAFVSSSFPQHHLKQPSHLPRKSVKQLTYIWDANIFDLFIIYTDHHAECIHSRCRHRLYHQPNQSSP